MEVSEAKEILLSTSLNPLVREALNVLLPDLLDYKNLPGEEWRDIVNYEGIYQVSSCGRIRSFQRGKVKLLKPQVTEDGYLYVCPFKNGNTKNFFIHILVAQAFISNHEGEREVNHIDGNKSNNSVENLEWSTPSENKNHAIKIGLIKIGCERHNAKLTVEHVHEIRQKCIPGDQNFGFQAFAVKFNMSATGIKQVYEGESYKSVT